MQFFCRFMQTGHRVRKSGRRAAGQGDAQAARGGHPVGLAAACGPQGHHGPLRGISLSSQRPTRDAASTLASQRDNYLLPPRRMRGHQLGFSYRYEILLAFKEGNEARTRPAAAPPQMRAHRPRHKRPHPKWTRIGLGSHWPGGARGPPGPRDPAAGGGRRSGGPYIPSTSAAGPRSTSPVSSARYR